MNLDIKKKSQKLKVSENINSNKSSSVFNTDI